MKVLVCGGAGYIGSHTCVALAARGHVPVVFDNLGNASAEALRRVSELVGLALPFVQGDVRDAAALDALFAREGIEAVIHFAALKAVGESVREPLRYFDNNIGGTIALLQAMQRAGVAKLVFSSSAMVYGDAATVNPYGRSKWVMEQLIGDLCAAEAGFGAMLLRYFNPVGAQSTSVTATRCRRRIRASRPAPRWWPCTCGTERPAASRPATCVPTATPRWAK